ncbi:hypothetical protein [Coleofasciculus sp. E2-BRE-01]
MQGSALLKLIAHLLSVLLYRCCYHQRFFGKWMPDAPFEVFSMRMW